MPLHKSLHKMCKTSWWKKNSAVLLCKSLWFRVKNIDQMCTSYKFKNSCSIESWLFSYDERYTYYESKKDKKRIKSQKSSEFASFF